MLLSYRLPSAFDRYAELRTPELADLREATRTDGAGISHAESALGSLTFCNTSRAA